MGVSKGGRVTVGISCSARSERLAQAGHGLGLAHLIVVVGVVFDLVVRGHGPTQTGSGAYLSRSRLYFSSDAWAWSSLRASCARPRSARDPIVAAPKHRKRSGSTTFALPTTRPTADAATMRPTRPARSHCWLFSATLVGWPELARPSGIGGVMRVGVAWFRDAPLHKCRE